jgi:sigma-B regulation protein RsbU (phosphoserine phosphatase)
MNLDDLGFRSRTIWRRLVTGGPHVDEALSISVLSAIILIGLGVIALVDHSVSSFPLASLYILPLALCALVYPFRVALLLSFGCWLLHDFVTPFREAGLQQHVLRGVTSLLGYLVVVGVVNGLATQRRRAAELAIRQRDELAAEIILGAEVQQSILPRSIPKIAGFEFAARMQPAKVIAGDYYGFIELSERRTAIIIADVSGKGVAAGLLMPSIEVALRMEARKTPATGDLLCTFNNVVHQITDGRRFISLFYGELCHHPQSLQYANAGHNPPLLIRATEDSTFLAEGGPVLGVLPGADYKTDVVSLRMGDVLILFTDGIVEAENADGEEYSVNRLASLVRSKLGVGANALIDEIFASVAEFRGPVAQLDDMTVVVVRVT